MRVAEALFVPRVVQGGVQASSAAAAGAVFRLPLFAASAAPAGATVQTLRAAAGPGLRRREMVRAGRGLVEALERLKLALLEGVGGETQIETLQRRLDEAAGQASGDAALDEIIDAVRLRAEVEIAKRQAGA